MGEYIINIINPCKWKDLKINEVFVEDAYQLDIFIKLSDKSARFLATNAIITPNHSGVSGDDLGNIIRNDDCYKWEEDYAAYYKLPSRTQRFWRDTYKSVKGL